MHYYIIYSCDVHRTYSLTVPPGWTEETDGEVWRRTEDDGDWDWDYLGNESDCPGCGGERWEEHQIGRMYDEPNRHLPLIGVGIISNVSIGDKYSWAIEMRPCSYCGGTGNFWANGKHGKWVTVEPIDQEAMDEFIERTYVMPECETMGSLTEFGLLPAYSFRAECDSSGLELDINAYVTPIPDDEDIEPLGLKPPPDDQQEVLVPMTDEDQQRALDHNWNTVVEFMNDRWHY